MFTRNVVLKESKTTFILLDAQLLFIIIASFESRRASHSSNSIVVLTQTTSLLNHLKPLLCYVISTSVATPWVFSQDLGFLDPILGSWFFDCLGFFKGFFKELGFTGFLYFTEKYIYLSVFRLEVRN